MSTYKVEISKKFGTFRAKFGEATAFSSADETELKDMDEVVNFVKKNAAGLNLEEGDSVVFREIAYTSIGDLTREVKRAPY